MMEVTTGVWLATLAGLALMFAVDFVVVERRVHAFTTREATAWVLFYVSAALVFASHIWVRYGSEYGKQFIAGWITEYSLSVDNLFVFIVLLSSFSVPAALRHRVLLIGVAIAIVLRGIMIIAGTQAVERFQPTFFVFGAFLGYTAWKVWGSGEDEADPEGNALVRRIERVVPVSPEYHGSRMFVRIAGRRGITPLFLVIVAVGTTDVLFALDSIPAVLGLTQVAYIVFTANAFALMGLRQLYFLLDGLLGKIVHLSKGLAIILGFIALKLVLEATAGVTKAHVPEISIGQSLGVIAGTLLITVLTSLWSVRRDPSLAFRTELAEYEREAVEHEGEALEAIEDLDEKGDDGK